jgi:fluoride exporter
MVNYLLVGGGGLIGSMLRYWLSGTVAHATKGEFPIGTLVVNVIGCFIIGFFLTLGYERFAWRPELRLFVAVGILGGFTTFSTFSYETIALFRDGSYFPAIANATASLLGCLVATFLGIALARKV